MKTDKEGLNLLVGKSNVATWAIVIFGSLVLWLGVYVYLEVMDRVDYSYFKINTSLEQIHKAKIDTYSGELLSITDPKTGKEVIIKEITSDQEVQRKKNKKWHLRHLFK